MKAFYIKININCIIINVINLVGDIMLKIEKSQIYINDESKLILSGEIHYYRQKKQNWQKALDNLKEAGCNCVATYIPWICHEYLENDFDFTGKYHEENDLVSFLKLVKENDLFLIARPGPFVMAEMKNEGIPYWVFDKDVDILPKTWDERITYNKTCDYLNPNYLECAKHWYSHIIPLLAPYELSRGGNMIMLQLDNEVGMLSWVCNCPDLTDTVCNDFINYLNSKYSKEEILNRYKEDITFKLLRSPNEEIALNYHYDLGLYMRYRTIKYFDILKEYANTYGICDTPLTFNIHGSGGSRAKWYPIGISQLYDAFKSNNNYVPGSDMYIGNIGIGNFQDIYLANIFAKCISNEHQPLTGMEFEGGAGDYGDSHDDLTEPQAIDIKTRLYIALGNKMLNLYLFSGGENYRLDENIHDGNGRIAITGQRHGYRASIDYKSDKNVSFYPISDVMNLMKANSKYLANSFPKFDNIKFGFIPDYYMTEFHYPNSNKQRHLHDEIKIIRDNGALNITARSLILGNRSFDCVNLQDEDVLDKIGNDVLIVNSTRYMHKDIQKKIVDHIQNGNNILIYGFIPEFDIEGNECTILKDFLNVKSLKDFRELNYPVMSVYPDGRFNHHYEVRCGIGQTLDVSNTDCEIILREYETKECCGYIKEYGKSRVCVISCYYHCNLAFFDELYNYLGCSQYIKYQPQFYGTYANMTVNDNNEGYINIFTLDGYEKEDYLYLNNEKIFKNKIKLSYKKCAMLPYNLKINDNFIIEKANAEIIDINDKSITFRPIQKNTEIYLIKNNEKIELEYDNLENIVINF